MRILFADTFQAPYLAEIKDAGHECVYQPELAADDLSREIGGFDALVVRSTKVTAETIGAADRLGLVIRAGAGTNTIDKQAAADKGIYVCNVPGKNAVAVAELAFGLVMALDRNIPDCVADLRAGRWDKRRYAKARGLYGRTVGVVGLGDIGLAFAERASAFGLRVHAVAKPGRSPEAQARAEALGTRYVDSLAELAATCDILSFHVPATDDTKGMIGRELLGHVRPGTWIINTSRGEIVDEPALIEAMDAKGVRAGIDVYNDEPGSGKASWDSPLARHPNVYGTHHIGASTDQAQEAIAAEVVGMLADYQRGAVPHCVNLADADLSSATLTVRHHDEIGVLSEVLAVLKDASLNVEQMENRIFAGARAACATMHVSGHVPPDVGERVAKVDRVIGVDVRLDGASR